MKRLVIVLAIVALVAAMVLGGLIWHEHRLRAERTREVNEDVREEARKLIHLCTLDGFATKIAMGTSHFVEYFRTNPATAAQVLSDIVDPVISAQELACISAQTDIASVQRDSETPDRFIATAAPTVAANLATLARVRAASTALASALAGHADLVTLQQRLDALHVSSKGTVSP